MPNAMPHDAPTASTLSTAAKPSGAPPAIRVALGGKHGEGHSMTLDAADWQHARETWGEAWTRTPAGHVVSGTGDRKGATRLARLLLGAKTRHSVVFRDDDPLNLRRANLGLLRTEQKAARLARVQRIAQVLLMASTGRTITVPHGFLR